MGIINAAGETNATVCCKFVIDQLGTNSLFYPKSLYISGAVRYLQQSKTQWNMFLQHNGFSQSCSALTKSRIPMYTSNGIEFQFFDSSFILQLKPIPSGLSSSPMPMKDGQMGVLMKLAVVATQDSKYATSNKHANHQT